MFSPRCDVMFLTIDYADHVVKRKISNFLGDRRLHSPRAPGKKSYVFLSGRPL